MTRDDLPANLRLYLDGFVCRARANFIEIKRHILGHYLRNGNGSRWRLRGRGRVFLLKIRAPQKEHREYGKDNVCPPRDGSAAGIFGFSFHHPATRCDALIFVIERAAPFWLFRPG